MSYLFIRRPLVATVLLAVAGGVFAQATTTTTQPAGSNAGRNISTKGPAGVASGDKKFMETAARHGIAEVELGKLAQDRGASTAVKEYGARMVKDHGTANDELKTLASNKGVQLPTAPDQAHQRKMDRMQKLSGTDFDKAYMKDMVSDHKKDVSEFRKQSKSAKDSDVKGFATKTLPTLEEHLQLAQQAEKGSKVAKRGS